MISWLESRVVAIAAIATDFVCLYRWTKYVPEDVHKLGQVNQKQHRGRASSWGHKVHPLPLLHILHILHICLHITCTEFYLTWAELRELLTAATLACLSVWQRKWVAEEHQQSSSRCTRPIACCISYAVNVVCIILFALFVCVFQMRSHFTHHTNILTFVFTNCSYTFA